MKAPVNADASKGKVDDRRKLMHGYHGRPSMKPSPWHWHVPTYVALIGAGGAAQIIAALARVNGDPRLRSVVRNGRLLGLVSSLLGAPLLIADLKTPNRFYNMIRIFRRTSPMSIGSWLLMGFGTASAATVLSELVGRARGPASRLWRRTEAPAQIPAALLGAGMATYTGALLSSTSVPLWQAEPELLTARFGASAFAAGAACLAILERASHDRHGNAAGLELIAAAATATGLALSVLSDRAYATQGVDGPLCGTPEGVLANVGAKWLGQVLPLVLLASNATRRRRSRMSIIADLAIIGGSFALRHSIMRAEKRSAHSPADYLGLTSPGPRGPAAKLEGRQRWSAREQQITAETAHAR